MGSGPSHPMWEVNGPPGPVSYAGEPLQLTTVRDTSYLPAKSWTVIRFIADNPGRYSTTGRRWQRAWAGMWIVCVRWHKGLWGGVEGGGIAVGLGGVGVEVEVGLEMWQGLGGEGVETVETAVYLHYQSMVVCTGCFAQRCFWVLSARALCRMPFLVLSVYYKSIPGNAVVCLCLTALGLWSTDSLTEIPLVSAATDKQHLF
jgi:hypothetical protein